MDSRTFEGAHQNDLKKFHHEVPPPGHFIFIPKISPPTLSPASILRVFARSIDKQLVSGFGSTKYKLLVEEFCAFVEDIDSNAVDKSASLESRLVKLIDGLNPLESKPITINDYKGYANIPGFMMSFDDLFRPLVVYYPPQGDALFGKTLFSIESAAHPVRFDSIWRGLTGVWAEDIWKLFALLDELLISRAKRFPEAATCAYPKSELLSKLRRRCFSFDTEPIWLGSEERIIQFLNTCTSFRSIKTTIDLIDGYVEEGGYKFSLQKDHSLRADKFCRFMRHIVVPVEQTVGIISGRKVTITPILWDPHQTYDALRKKTSYRFYPKYLDWDENTESFTGYIKLTSSLTEHTYVDIRCDIYALTSEVLPESIKFETTVQSFINLRVYLSAPDRSVTEPETLRVQEFSRPQISQTRQKSRENFELDFVANEGCSFWQHSSPSSLRLTAFKAENKINPKGLVGEPGIINHGNTSKVLDTISSYDAVPPIFKQRRIMNDESIISLRWDLEQWFSVIFRTKPEGKSEWESISNHSFLSDNSVDVQATASRVGKLLEDNLEQVQYEGDNLTLGLEIELVLAKSDYGRSGSRVFEEITAIFKQLPSIKVQSVGNVKPNSFGSVIFEVDSKMKDMMLGYKNELERQVDLFNLGIDIQQQRCIQWRKLVLPKILRSLRKFDDDVNDIFTISLHIGKKGGYNLQDIKRVAKAITIYGDLFDNTKLMHENFPDKFNCPDFEPNRCDLYPKESTTIKNINLIDKATSLSDVMKVMNPDYHDIEGYRFSFSKLKSQGTIVWKQSIPKACAGDITGFTAAILSVTTAAMMVEDSHFVELAKNSATWDNLALLLERNRFGTMNLDLSKGKGKVL